MSNESREREKILIFSTAYFPMVGGAEVAVREITERMQENEFHLITARMEARFPARQKMGNVTIYRVGFGSRLDKFFLPILGVGQALILNRREGGFDLAWSMMASWAGIAGAIFKFFSPRIPMVLTLQEGDKESSLERYAWGVSWLYKAVIRPWHRWPVRAADTITVISDILNDRASLMGAEAPIVKIPNGVDLGLFKSVKKNSEIVKSLRNRFRLDKGDKVVLTVSRLVYKNAVDVAIRAIALINSKKLGIDSRPSVGNNIKGGRVKFLVVGHGDERDNLENMVEEAGLEGDVIFTGVARPEEVPAFMALADVFLRPSRSEGFGNVFVEAMAAGVPVVAGGVGGILDFVRDKENGLLVEPDNVEETAKAVLAVLDSASLRRRLITKGRETAKNYNWKEIAIKMGGVFKNTKSSFLTGEGGNKIVAAAPIFLPEVGGPATYAGKLMEFSNKSLKMKRGRAAIDEGVEGGRDLDFSVGVVSYGERGIYKMPNKGRLVRVSRWWPVGFRHLIYVCRLWVMTYRSGAKTVYALDALGAGWPAWITAKILRRKLAVRVGGDILWEREAERGLFEGGMADFYNQKRHKRGRSRFLYWAVRFVLRGAERVIVPTGMLAEVYRDYYGVEEKRIKVILNPMPVIKASEVEKDDFGWPYFLFAGRLVKYKNLENLIKAFEIFKKKSGRSDFRLLIVGDGPEKERLEKLIKEKNLEEYIYIRDSIGRDKILTLIKGAKAGVLVSWTEYSPNFALECLALGKPVVLSRENGLEMNFDFELLVDPFSEESIAEGMEEALRVKKEKRREGRGGWEEVIGESVREIIN